ncbi:MAG: PEP-CTERM sorting domain-containing protein [Armatimonadetes bacterium]|nr:PEP-CTERM sorting domain-containing protein [Armatimonadota bacterium]
MRHRLLPLVAVAVLAVAVTPAFADFSPVYTDWTSWTPATGSGTLSFPQFDDLGGALTLQNVYWEFGTFVNGKADFHNNSEESSATCFYIFYDTTDVYDGLGNSLGQYLPQYNSGNFAVAPLASVTKSGTSTTEGDSGVWNSAAHLAYFTGAGNVVGFDFDAVLYEIFGKPDYVSVQDYDNTTYVAGTIQYEYRRTGDIPEPGTLALVGLGLIGLVGVVRRRKVSE